MFYRENLPGWERGVRVAGGLGMIACGYFGLNGMPFGWLLDAAGLVTLATGFVGYCPACALAGRKLGRAEAGP